jgi:erythrin-vacuolar iron transport family protein
MGFAEALSDDGTLTGRGHPWLRGGVTGLMTSIGGIGHTLPYLIANFRVATTVAIAVVLVELWAIAWIRSRYMDTRSSCAPRSRSCWAASSCLAPAF